jgi:hypothetical protein
MEISSTFNNFLHIYQADTLFDTNSTLGDDNNIFTGEGSSRSSNLEPGL